MAREVRPGTPVPSERPCERGDVRDFAGQRVGSGPCVDREGRRLDHGKYIFPVRRNPALRFSLIGAALLAFTTAGLYFVGSPARPNQDGPRLRTALSPGRTYSRHSLAVFDCAQCHRDAHNVEDVRCERCHDPTIAARLSNAAHVFAGTGDIREAMAAPVVQCTTCHVEHRGAEVDLADVDDRECGACHRVDRNAWTRLTTLRRHPEFALVRAGMEAGGGLRWFNHQMHLRKVADKFQQGCEACHERAPRDAAFKPIAFARHCATCHEADLDESASGLPTTIVAALGAPPASIKVRPDSDDPGRQVFRGLKHADPWVLRTVHALRAAADPAGAAAERVTLDRQVAQLELMRTFAPLRAGSAAWTGLERALQTGGAEVTGDTSVSVDRAVKDTAGAVESLAKALGPLDPMAQTLATEAARLKDAPSLQPSGAAGAVRDHGGVEPLLQLVDATVARAQAAGDQGLVQRATALRARIEKLPPAARTQGMSTAAVGRLEALLKDLRQVPDPGLRSETGQVAYLARITQYRTAAGIDPAAFDLHRQRMLQLLDAIQQSVAKQTRRPMPDPGVDSLLARVGALRQRILSTYYGLPPDVAVARSRFFRDREIVRARVDSELDAAALRLPAPAESSNVAGNQLQARLDQLRVRLAAVGTAPTLPAPMSAGDARIAVSALLGAEAPDADQNTFKKNRCTLCHELAPSGLQLAPVRRAGGSLLVNASFTHEPHMTADAGNCDTCHTTIRSSTSARDLNIPGVDSCRTCHASGKQAAKATGCEACHQYHVPAASALMWVP